MHCAGGMVEIFLFILVAGLLANFIGASVHEGIFVGALVSLCSPLHADKRLCTRPQQSKCSMHQPPITIHASMLTALRG